MRLSMIAMMGVLAVAWTGCGDAGLLGQNGGGGGSATGGTAGSGGANSGSGGTAGAGGTSSGTGGTTGDPRFLADCSGGPLAAPIADCRPDPLPSTGDPYADCVTRINQLRWECQCLPALQQWIEGQSCADQHAEYDSELGAAHAGFRDGICQPGGWAQNECPGWRSEEHVIEGCLQAMWDEGPGEPFSEHGHYINMTNASYSMVACGFYETPGGDVWAVQNFQ